jgi:NitT/TauT family transport system substrate-binding protein
MQTRHVRRAITGTAERFRRPDNIPDLSGWTPSARQSHIQFDPDPARQRGHVMKIPEVRRVGAARRTRRTAIGAVLSAGVVMAGTACSSSSSQGGTNASAPQHYNITVGQSSATYDGSPEKVVSQDGQFAAHGITEKNVLLSSSSTVLAGLVSGGVDFGLTNSFSVLAARATGVPVVAVCGTYKGISGLALVVSSKLTKSLHLVPGDVNGDLRKLKGQNIGVSSPTSTGGKVLTGLEKAAGLGTSWVKEVSISTSDSVTAVAHGEVAGFIGNVPNPQEAVAQHTGVIAFDMGQVPEFQGIQYDVIATSESFLKTHPQEVKAFLQVVAEGESDLAAKKPAALKAIAGTFSNGLPASVIDGAATTGVEQNCSMSSSAWQKSGQVLNKLGLATKTVSPSEVSAAYHSGL